MEKRNKTVSGKDISPHSCFRESNFSIKNRKDMQREHFSTNAMRRAVASSERLLV